MSAQVAASKAIEQGTQGYVPLPLFAYYAEIRDRGVLLKLIIFSLSLGIVPISSYFLTEKYVWDGEPLSLTTLGVLTQ